MRWKRVGSEQSYIKLGLEAVLVPGLWGKAYGTCHLLSDGRLGAAADTSTDIIGTVVAR